MRCLALCLAGLILPTLACGLFTPASLPTADPVPATGTSSVSPSFTAIPTFTTQPPTLPAPPPAALPPAANYLLKEERLINGYAIRLWTNPNSEFGFDDMLVIEAAGQVPIPVEMVSALNDLTGTDVNNDGYPDVVIETYSGGAHCCFGTQVFSLRPTAAALILQKPESNAGGFFEDLNADGVSEFVTYDDSFAYQYCPYAAGVTVKAILAYNPARDYYLPASPRFPAQYADEIATNEERAAFAPGELGEWDGTNVCAILPLSLDYLYSGQPDKARSEFQIRYSGPDSGAKWMEILHIVQASPLYVP